MERVVPNRLSDRRPAPRDGYVTIGASRTGMFGEADPPIPAQTREDLREFFSKIQDLYRRRERYH